MADETDDGPERKAPLRVQSPWSAFTAAHDEIVGQMEARLAAAGLPEVAWYNVLWALEQVDGRRMRMHELADAAVMPRPTLTRLVDRMEKAGLVARERSETDRRGAYTCLTDEGAAMRARMWEVYGAAVRDIFEDRMSKDEAAMLKRIMTRLIVRDAD